jgi:hypothetical protein
VSPRVGVQRPQRVLCRGSSLAEVRESLGEAPQLQIELGALEADIEAPGIRVDSFVSQALGFVEELRCALGVSRPSAPLLQPARREGQRRDAVLG